MGTSGGVVRLSASAPDHVARLQRGLGLACAGLVGQVVTVGFVLFGGREPGSGGPLSAAEWGVAAGDVLAATLVARGMWLFSRADPACAPDGGEMEDRRLLRASALAAVPAAVVMHGLIAWMGVGMGPLQRAGWDSAWSGVSTSAAMLLLLRIGLVVGVFYSSLRFVRRVAERAGEPGAGVALAARRWRWVVPLVLLAPALVEVRMPWLNVIAAPVLYVGLLLRMQRVLDEVAQPRGGGG